MDQRPITLCGCPLRGPRHICAFFDSREQEYEAFLPYFREGIANGERIVVILDAEMRGRMREHPIDVDGAEARGQLDILASDETYIRGGYFAKDRMRDLVEEALRAAQETPYRHVRTLGEMDWALRNLPGTDELIEYECVLNELLATYDCTLACAYDLAKFNGRIVMDVLATHSHVLLDGAIRVNPYYIEPEEYRRHLARRRSGPVLLAR